MASTRFECHRLDPAELAALTPRMARPGILPVAGRLSLIYLAPAVGLVCAGNALWPPAAYLIAVVLFLGIWGDWKYRKGIAEIKLERQRFEKQRDVIMRCRRIAENANRVSGIRGGMWVCDKAEYERERKALRRQNSSDPSEPEVNYRLVVATIMTDGRTQRIAFTDGTAVDWHPSSPVYTTRTEILSASAVDLTDQPPAALSLLVDHVGEGISADELVRFFGSERQEALTRSLEIGSFWGLVEMSDGGEPSHTIQSMRNGHVPPRVNFRVTEAGQVWRLCSAESIAARRKEKQMSDRRGPQFKFYKGSQNNVNYAEGDIVNPVANFGPRPTDDRLLQVLSQLLERSDLPWDDPGLADVRPDIERAVAQRNAQDPALLKAVRRLMDFGGAIALGVGGNAAYEVLKAFAQ